METTNIIYGLAGLVIGGIGTSAWLGYKIKDLKNTILDKRTIVRFLKEALDEHTPKQFKKPFKRKPSSYKGNTKPRVSTLKASTVAKVATKTVTRRKKVVKAS